MKQTAYDGIWELRAENISNSDIKAKLNVEVDTVEKIHASRLRCFGHVTKMDKCLPLYGRVQGYRAKVVLENAGQSRQTMFERTVDAVDWLGYCEGYSSSCGQTTLEVMHTAVTACLGIALITTRRRRKQYIKIVD